MWFRRRKVTRQNIVKSEQAILEASKAKKEVEALDQEVHEISGALKDLRERNHFADKLRIIMEGR